MASSMQQVYRDEEGGISVTSPLVSASSTETPRWAKQSSRRKYMGRIAITSAALFGVYLLFCSWVAFTRRVEATVIPNMQGAGSAIVDTFPHPPQHPWPHPPKGPKHPPHHPHPPPHPPSPTVLACAALPTASNSVAETTTIDVTLPTRAKVVLSDWLLHGDLSVSRTDNELTGNQITSETNLSVTIKTIPASIPDEMRLKALKVDLEEETDEDSEKDDDEEDSDLFVLCAISFDHPHPPPPPPFFSRDSEVQVEESEGEEGHPPHRRPPPPPAPVIISIFPALNETYPKLPKPPKHHHRHHRMSGGVSELATNVAPSPLKKAFRSTVSFLFPMLSIFPQHHGHKSHHHHKHGHPMPPPPFPHHPPPFPHHPPHPPPPPPFWVIETDVTLPRFVPVEFGFHPPPPPPPRPWFGRH